MVTFLICFFLIFAALIPSCQPFSCFSSTPGLVLSGAHSSPCLLYSSYTMATLFCTVCLPSSLPLDVVGRRRDRWKMLGAKITGHLTEARLTPVTRVFSVFWISAWPGRRTQPEWRVVLHCAVCRVSLATKELGCAAGGGASGRLSLCPSLWV